MNAILAFTGTYRFLSNFWPVPHGITFDGVTYPTVEHAYCAAKTVDPYWRNVIRNAPTPAAAKRAGRAAVLRPDWHAIKLDHMRAFVAQKFAPGTELNRQLVDTDDRLLIEGNCWHDTYWGQCAGRGENHLGRLLMEQRERNRAFTATG